jgi:hypothetical protein
MTHVGYEGTMSANSSRRLSKSRAGPPYPSARLPRVCYGGHTVVTHALSLLSSMRYGRVSSNSVTDEASKFTEPQKNPYVLVHNSKLVHSDPTDADLNRHKRGLPPWSSKFQIRPLSFLPNQYSPLSPNCPAWSPIMPTFP